MGTMDDLRDIAHKFECVKVRMNQNKDGIMVTLLIHPNDMPEEFFRDGTGTRYVAALVPLTDHDEPRVTERDNEKSRAVASAGMICKQEGFWYWLVSNGYAEEVLNEQQAAETLRNLLGIASRKELRDNRKAREKFYEIRDAYIQGG